MKPTNNKNTYLHTIALILLLAISTAGEPCIAVLGRPRQVLPFAATVFEGVVVSERFEVEVTRVWRGNPSKHA